MFVILCLCLDFRVISSSALKIYTYVWFALLYLLLVFFKFDFRHLYLFLVCNIIPMSVMVTSAFFNFDYTYVQCVKNGLYTIVRYIYLWRPKMAFDNYRAFLLD